MTMHRIAAVASVLLAVWGSGWLGATPPAHFDDAPIHAIQMVDRTEGWAVGAEGVIWHTIDGGQHWERQPSGVRGTLCGLHFVTPYTGWVVGREELPDGSGSSGIILVTRDGGEKWERLAAGVLPGLASVKFFGNGSGVVAGDSSHGMPAGVFRTSDGGISWQQHGGPRCPGWCAADFSDADNGAVAGAWSRLAIVRNGLFRAADVDSLAGRSVRGLRLAGKMAVAVGDGGLVLLSKDSAGARYGFAELGLPPEVLASLDFNAVAIAGRHIWVAGRPGSVVLHSADWGATWEVQKTGQPLAIHGLCFLNSEEGWAVGELGTILATSDGGKTWRLQRRGHQRAAVLCVHAHAQDVPTDTVALLGAEDGYLVTALRVLAADPASARVERATDQPRLRSAMRQLAGAAADSLWQFPVPAYLDTAKADQLLSHWDQLHAGNAARELRRQLVLALRIWRPEVILTDSTTTPTGQLVQEAMRQVFREAADPKVFPEQLTTLGLSCWQAKKLYALDQSSTTAQVHLDLTRPRARLHDAPAEFAASPASIAAAAPVRLPDERHYRLLMTTMPEAVKADDLMAGLELAPGGTARRPLPAYTETDAATLDRLAKGLQLKRTLSTLNRLHDAGLASPDQIISQLPRLFDALPQDTAVRAGLALAKQYVQMGQWPLARETFLSVADRYPAHPLTIEAYRWLARYHASSELRRRQELGHFHLSTQTQFVPSQTTQPTQPTKHQPGVIAPAGLDVQIEQKLTTLSGAVDARSWYAGSLAVESRLNAYGAMFAMDPSVQLALCAARRHLGKLDESRAWLSAFLGTHPVAGDPWREVAALEAWQTGPNGLPPRPIANCRQLPTRPFLDGQISDDEYAAQPLPLRDAVGTTAETYPTRFWLAYDRQYLYFAVDCKHPAGHEQPTVKARGHDADVRPFDRVELLLDLDRDYQTYYRFIVDQRGCTAEDCWGDATWNPKWHVAVKATPTGWTAEVAIPLSELTGENVGLGRNWAMNVVRVLPGRGVQGWSCPADVQPRPEGMGLLHFAAPAKRP
jgi:photosystem II stability/assembly factor-like uncharacterized protein